jgi:hypothetical protein
MKTHKILMVMAEREAGVTANCGMWQISNGWWIDEAAMPKPVKLSEIRTVLDDLPGQEGDSLKSGWTQIIKARLCQLAASHSAQVCASGCAGAYWPEWLYDVVWLRVDEAPLSTMILDSPFVAEIEWSRDGAVRDDFQKLLLSRADTRLMIFQAWDEARVHTLVDALVEQVKAYARTQDQDRYLFAGYGSHTRCFYYREYVHTIPGDSVELERKAS